MVECEARDGAGVKVDVSSSTADARIEGGANCDNEGDSEEDGEDVREREEDAERDEDGVAVSFETREGDESFTNVGPTLGLAEELEEDEEDERDEKDEKDEEDEEDE